MFWSERKIGEETYLHVKLLSPNGGRARVHYIGFKVLEEITEALLLAKSIFKGIMGGDRGAGGWDLAACDTSLD
eukprot:COSAG05_NODE_391_length_10419_cov_8.156686_4_plen_74_part_00